MKNNNLDDVKNILFLIENKKFERAQEEINKYKGWNSHDLKHIGLQVKLYNELRDSKAAYEYGMYDVNMNFNDRFAYTLFIREFTMALVKVANDIEKENKENANKKYELATNLLIEAIRVTGGEVPKLIKQLADIYSIQDNYEMALELYDIYTKPENENFMNLHKLKLLYKTGRYEDCIELANGLFDVTIDIYQRQTKYFYIGESYFKLGDYEKAKANYRKALTKDNKIGTMARVALNKIEALTEEDQGNYFTQNTIDIHQANKSLTRINNNIQN